MFIDITLLYINVLYVFMYSLFVTVVPMLFLSPRLISSCMHLSYIMNKFELSWIELFISLSPHICFFDTTFTLGEMFPNLLMFPDSSKLKFWRLRMFTLKWFFRIWLFTLNGMRYQWYVGTRLLSVMFPYWKWLSNLRKHEENLKIQTY